MSSSRPRFRPPCGYGWLLACLGLTACAGPSVTAPVNLGDPGWSVRRGQAVWLPGRHGTEIAGELLVAQRAGATYVQFAKPPLTIVEVQTSAQGWRLEFPPRHRTYAGHGTPPGRTVWLQLGPVLDGQTPAAGWEWRPAADGPWRLENSARGESLEGVFLP